MADLRISYFRMLIGDNGPVETYTDDELRSVSVIPQPVSPLPAAVLLAGVQVFRRFPATVAGDWGAMTAEDWASMTPEKWAEVQA